MPVITKKREHNDNTLIWLSSLVFSSIVLIGYKHLETRALLVAILLSAVIHVLIVSSRCTALSRTILASQGFIVLVTIVAVLLYLRHAVGPADGAGPMILSFFIRALKDQSTCTYFFAHALVFTVIVIAAYYIFHICILRRKADYRKFLVFVYSASATGLVVDYSLGRPLFHVSGDPDAAAFFYAAGLFGLEFSLALYLLVFILCVALCFKEVNSGHTKY